MNTSAATALLREIVLSADVPTDLRRRSLDLLLVGMTPPMQSAAILCNDVPTGTGVQLSGLTPINAIKKLRDLMPGLGLKEAKDRVDALEATGRIHLSRHSYPR